MKTVLLDYGHGGVIDGKYVTAPAKQFRHADGWAYEGVLNRQLGRDLEAFLKADSIPYIVLTQTQLDTPLRQRTDLANRIMADYPCFLVSLHRNASSSNSGTDAQPGTPGAGTGYEFFTSPGVTQSDTLATMIHNAFKAEFPEARFRVDFSDGDPDKEAKFHMLTQSNMPACLVESLFFDNTADWQKIKSAVYVQREARALWQAIRRFA